MHYHSMYKEAVAFHCESFMFCFGDGMSLLESFSRLLTLFLLLVCMKYHVLSRIHLFPHLCDTGRLDSHLITQCLHFLYVHVKHARMFFLAHLATAYSWANHREAVWMVSVCMCLSVNQGVAHRNCWTVILYAKTYWQTKTTWCLKKIPTWQSALTLSNLNRFS